MPPTVPRSCARRSLLLLALLSLPGCGGAVRHTSGASAVAEAHAAALMLLADNAIALRGQHAATRSAAPAVLAYAARERTDHGATASALTALLDSLHVTPREDARAEALRTRLMERGERLPSRGGREFEIAYVDLELESHRELLVLLGQLEGEVADPRLREHVAALRPMLAAHSAHAEQVRATLAQRR